MELLRNEAMEKLVLLMVLLQAVPLGRRLIVVMSKTFGITYLNAILSAMSVHTIMEQQLVGLIVMQLLEVIKDMVFTLLPSVDLRRNILPRLERRDWQRNTTLLQDLQQLMEQQATKQL